MWKDLDNLSMTLQKESISAAEVQEIAKLTVDTSKGMRSDNVFKLFFQLVESIREKTDTEEAIYQESVKHLDVWKLGIFPGLLCSNFYLSCIWAVLKKAACYAQYYAQNYWNYTTVHIQF